MTDITANATTYDPSERRRQQWRQHATTVISHVGALVIWELIVRVWNVPTFILPPPSKIIVTLFEPRYDWLGNSWTTMIEILGGYTLAVVLGVASALLLSWSRILNMLVFPIMVTANMIPKVALGPLVIVWFSYGVQTNILITFSLCYFPILLTASRGLKEVEPDLLDLVRTLKGSRWQMFAYIQLPGALPYIFSGMKVATILGVAGAIVGEFIASGRGLGYLMIQVQASLDTPAMFMSVTLITLIGIVLYMAVLLAEKLVVPTDARMS